MHLSIIKLVHMMNDSSWSWSPTWTKQKISIRCLSRCLCGLAYHDNSTSIWFVIWRQKCTGTAERSLTFVIRLFFVNALSNNHINNTPSGFQFLYFLTILLILSTLQDLLFLSHQLLLWHNEHSFWSHAHSTKDISSEALQMKHNLKHDYQM